MSITSRKDVALVALVFLVVLFIGTIAVEAVLSWSGRSTSLVRALGFSLLVVPCSTWLAWRYSRTALPILLAGLAAFIVFYWWFVMSTVNGLAATVGSAIEPPPLTGVAGPALHLLMPMVMLVLAHRVLSRRPAPISAS